MALHMLTGPPGSGKTRRVLGMFKEFTPSEHLASVRFIVPTVLRAVEIRRLLLSGESFPGILGRPVCTFYELSQEILTTAGIPGGGLISDTHKRLMLSEIIHDSGSGYFDGVRDCPVSPKLSAP